MGVRYTNVISAWGLHNRQIGETRMGREPQNAMPPRQGAPPPQTMATIIANNIPVGQLDSAVTGHLWLMFASQCYWTNQTTGRLTPVYDWRASVAAGGAMQTVPAEWDLLAGPGSLPREVRYLGNWGETNGLYRVHRHRLRRRDADSQRFLF